VEQTTLPAPGNVGFQVFTGHLMPGLVRARSKSRSLLVILPCGALALALSLLFREGELKPAAPAIFVLVVILVAHFSGRLASLLVAILGGLVFAGFLFRPYGRFALYNAADRVVLLLFAVCALAAVCLSKTPEN
jgi:K+-sensing histidine kinase KdpD